MSWLSAARNLTAHAFHRAAVAWERRSRAAAKTPLRQRGAVRLDLGAGVTALACPYALTPRAVHGQHPIMRVPIGWRPRAHLGLDAALPFAWDERYHKGYDQPFQPVKLWRNAIALAHVLESNPRPDIAQGVRDILDLLLARMRLYSSTNGDAVFIDNRFDYTLPNHAVIQGPWVSGISNAFAILACLRLRAHMDVGAQAQALARAYFTPQIEGGPVQPQWISFRDKRGYLWFEEYPQEGGRSTRVQNGHIFALLALHEMALVYPGQGYDAWARAGATTIAAHAACFRRPDMVPLYALDLPHMPDYLPNRAMRQMYQLYEMTGNERFLRYGDYITHDGRRSLTPDLTAAVLAQRAASVAGRAVIGRG